MSNQVAVVGSLIINGEIHAHFDPVTGVPSLALKIVKELPNMDRTELENHYANLIAAQTGLQFSYISHLNI